MNAILRFLFAACLISAALIPTSANATLAIDGTPQTGTSTSGTTVTATITTTHPNDVIVVCVFLKGTASAVSGVSGTGTTGWTQRVAPSLGGGFNAAIWYGTAASPLTSVTITVTYTPSGATAGLIVFAVSGANTSSITDSNASLPDQHSGSSGSAPASGAFSTSNANDLIFTVAFEENAITQTAGAGQTLLATVSAGTTLSVAAQYEIVSVTQSSITIAFGTSATATWGVAGDAIVAATAAAAAVPLRARRGFGL